MCLQVLTASMPVTLGLALACTVIQAAVTYARPGSAVLSHRFHVAQLVFGALALAVLSIAFVSWTWRVAVALRSKRSWGLQRRRAAQLAGVRALVMLVIIAAYMVSHADLLATPEHFCHEPVLLRVSVLVRWTGWNTMLLLTVAGARATMPNRSLAWASTALAEIVLWCTLQGALLGVLLVCLLGSRTLL